MDYMHTFRYILPIGVILTAMAMSCNDGGSSGNKDSYVIDFENDTVELNEPVMPPALSADADTSLLQSMVASVADKGDLSDSTFMRHLDSMPDINCVKLHVNPLGGSLARVFNDSNHVQLAAAEMLGIRPIESLSDAWNVTRPIKKVASCREFFVDNLTHSLPYLVPEAFDVLKEIGSRFNDTLQARGGGSYRIKVTSILRTATGVNSLRRGNVNAVKNSTHQFGTTFDISYVQFICDSMTVNRTQEDLKNLLAEILKEMSAEGKCYVKYERKQGCFHITARPQAEAVKRD